MSRFKAKGTNPENNDTVDIFWGWDEVPGFKPGYFFQVYSKREEDIIRDGEGILVNEGFIQGISKDRLLQLKKIWKAKITL